MAYIPPSFDRGYIDLESLAENVLALNITRSINHFIETNRGLEPGPAHIMAFTQRSWKLNPRRANACEYVWAIHSTGHKRKVVGVFVFSRGGDGGKPVDQFRISQADEDAPYRHTVLLEPANEEDWNRFINRYIPDSKTGAANPVKYFDDKTL